MNHWIRPSCDSRTGAAHLRRGAPCQDASGFAGFRDAAGTPVQVLVVSDGHGGSRYVRSAVGARLACEVAMGELRQALATARVDDPAALEDWHHWLAGELPARIVAAWLREVERHWQADPGVDGSGFSPVVYGATLGVLLLTPSWWAHTGLGDWDLVRIEAAGGEALLSEEPEREAAGEATFSLCLPRAERHFASRTALLPLTAETAPFALLLCSDGLRKSCGSDTDFLTLCRYLVGLSPSGDQALSAELAEALDHISRQGSGDDISVAVARWAPLSQGVAWPGPGRSLPPRLVQPASELVSGLPVDGAEAVASAALGALSPSGGTSGAGVAAPLAGAATGASAPPIASRRAGPASSGPQPAAGRRPSASVHRRRRQWPVVALVLLGLGGAGLVIAAVLGRGPLAGRREPAALVLTSRQRSDLLRQVALLCDAAAAPRGGQEPGAAALERTTAAGRRADAAGSGIPAAAQGPAPVAGSSAAGGAPSPPGRQPGATTTGQPPGGSVANGSDAVAAGSSLPPGSGMAQGSAGNPASTAAPVAGSLSSSASAVSRSPDPQRLQRIAATLAARASIFQRLERGESAGVTTALRQSQADPLTALIAYSATDPTVRPAPPPPERPGWLFSLVRQAAGLLPFATRPGGSASAPASPLAELGACPELIQALRAAWQRQHSRGAVQRPAAPSPAAVPLRAGGDGHAPSGPDPGASSR